MSSRPILRRRSGPPLRFVPPRWDATEACDPFGAALELHADPRTLLAATVAAALLYGGVTVFAIFARVQTLTPAARVELPVIEALPPPPPPNVPPPLEEPRRVQPRRARHAAPPPPAEAAQVLTRAADGPVDLSSFSIATGHGQTYGGGLTSGNGISHLASPNAARTVPRAARPAAPSQARAAQPARKDWSCGWPAEAQETDLRETRVIVKVDVSPDGDATAAQVQGSALAGFAEAARRCALSEQYRPALDAAGHRVAGETPLLLVHFVR